MRLILGSVGLDEFRYNIPFLFAIYFHFNKKSIYLPNIVLEIEHNRSVFPPNRTGMDAKKKWK